ncbi:hypothetical protein ABEB36_000328 [Hypothenemus hampei]|uniref:Uncharacterized protein n=1 Tax=Hypothenemus hampei TaxID=57062 RepID=A0ABD1FBK6_HYPHA
MVCLDLGICITFKEVHLGAFKYFNYLYDKSKHGLKSNNNVLRLLQTMETFVAGKRSPGACENNRTLSNKYVYMSE